jgi:hypothetical protein
MRRRLCFLEGSTVIFEFLFATIFDYCGSLSYFKTLTPLFRVAEQLLAAFDVFEQGRILELGRLDY